MSIHPTAIVHSSAIIGSQAAIGSRVQVGPYAVIEDEALIGAGCRIGAHAVIKKFTSIGAGNRVFEHAVLGGEPQDVKFKGESSSLIIGDDNLIREFCTLHRGCGEGEATRIGSRNFLMIGVHIAHNCTVGDDNILTNGAALAGHIVVEDHVFLSNNVGAHQFFALRSVRDGRRQVKNRAGRAAILYHGRQSAARTRIKLCWVASRRFLSRDAASVERGLQTVIPLWNAFAGCTA